MPIVTPGTNLKKVLLVDDDASFAYLFQRLVEKAGYSAITAQNGKEAIELINERSPSMIFLDLMMPGMSGFDVLEQLKENDVQIPIVVITAHGSVDNAVKSMHLGASDYLTKPIDEGKIRRILENFIPDTDLATPNSDSLPITSSEDRHILIGASPQMQELFKLIGAITMTPNDIPVLISGESGTGKELVARAIHRNGSAPDAPFVPINCTALPESLLESELFGHEKGAFAGAHEKRYGRFEYAKNGTIFLDEIGDLSPGMQQKLLRVLQEREFNRLGGNETLAITARFITATNRDLSQLVAQGQFRDDLLFRLRVFDIQIPPLRERKADIPMLAHHFLNKNTKVLNKRIDGLSNDALFVLNQYDFPGNVRELENIVRKAVILSAGPVIRPNEIDIHAYVDDELSPDFTFPFFNMNYMESREYYTSEFEAQFVKGMLKAYHGNITTAANACGMTRQNLQRLVTKHKIDADFFRQYS